MYGLLSSLALRTLWALYFPYAVQILVERGMTRAEGYVETGELFGERCGELYE